LTNINIDCHPCGHTPVRAYMRAGSRPERGDGVHRRHRSGAGRADLRPSGPTKRFSAVRWGVARSILIAWVLTLPAAGVAAAVAYQILRSVVDSPESGQPGRRIRRTDT
jgi:hypothetical protein